MRTHQYYIVDKKTGEKLTGKINGHEYTSGPDCCSNICYNILHAFRRDERLIGKYPVCVNVKSYRK